MNKTPYLVIFIVQMCLAVVPASLVAWVVESCGAPYKTQLLILGIGTLIIGVPLTIKKMREEWLARQLEILTWGFIPVTPGGTILEELWSKTKEGAIDNLMEDACHMPYRNWGEFHERGYRIFEVIGDTMFEVKE